MITAGLTLNEKYLVTSAERLHPLLTRCTARDTTQRRTVMIDALQHGDAHGDLRTFRAFADYLRRQAYVQSQINHPNIASLYEVVDQDDGQLLLVYDVAAAHTLDSFIQIHAPITLPIAASIATQIARVIYMLRGHALDIVHGDIRPQNILIQTTSNNVIVHVSGFGAAHINNPAWPNVPPPAELGRPTPYTAPELHAFFAGSIAASDITSAADVFSLGCILFEALTDVPFASATEQRWQLLQQTAPADYVSAIQAMVADNPSDRRLDLHPFRQRLTQAPADKTSTVTTSSPKRDKSPAASSKSKATPPASADKTDFDTQSANRQLNRRISQHIRNGSYLVALNLLRSLIQSDAPRGLYHGNAKQVATYFSQRPTRAGFKTRWWHLAKLDDYAYAIELDPNNLAYYDLRLASLRALAETDKGLKYYRRMLADAEYLIDHAPYHASAYFLFGLASEKLGVYEDAAAAYKRAYARNHPEAKAALKRLPELRRDAETKVALEAFLNDAPVSQQLNTRERRIRRELDCLVDARTWDAALSKLYELIAASAPPVPRRVYQEQAKTVGTHYWQRGMWMDTDSAEGRKRQLENFTRAIRLDPENAQYYVSRSEAYHSAARKENSRDHYLSAAQDRASAITLEPNRADHFRKRGQLYLQMAKQQMLSNGAAIALDDFEQAIRLDAQDADAFAYLARCYALMYQQETLPNGNQLAVEAITTAIKLNPQRAIYFFERASYYEHISPTAHQLDLEIAAELGYQEAQALLRAANNEVA